MLLHRVLKHIHKQNLLSKGDTVIVGISGGADSTALLHLLHSASLDLKLIAVYINHNLRPDEVLEEQHFIKQLSTTLNIAFRTISVDVTGYQQQHKCSLEEAARKLRYTALEKERKHHKATAIAVGHNADDQVEEFLIRMVRGSGLKGLSGISAQNGKIIRPLLQESKASLLTYLSRENLQFCHDSSNDDIAFLRNRIRHNLLPELEKQFNPAIRKTLLQTTSILAEDEDLLNQLATHCFEKICDIRPHKRYGAVLPRISFPIRSFVKEHQAIQRRVLEKIIWAMEIKPTYRTITQLQTLISTSNTNSTLHLPEGLRAHISGGLLLFSFPAGRISFRGDKEITHVQELEVTSTGVFTLPEIGRTLTITRENATKLENTASNKQFLNADKVTFPLQLRAVRQGEKMQLLGSPGRKKIARILSDRKIPVHNRPHHPLLVANDEVLCILGVQIAEQFRIEPDSKEMLVIRWEKMEES